MRGAQKWTAAAAAAARYEDAVPEPEGAPRPAVTQGVFAAMMQAAASEHVFAASPRLVASPAPPAAAHSEQRRPRMAAWPPTEDAGATPVRSLPRVHLQPVPLSPTPTRAASPATPLRARHASPAPPAGSSRAAQVDDLPAQVSLGDLEVLDKLGEGSGGVVYRARHRPSGKLVALKVVWRHRGARAPARR